jgi:hypothetical protein
MVVKYASGASAQALENGCLRFVPATKTHDDVSFAANHVSPTHFCLDSSLWMQLRSLLLLSLQPQHCMMAFSLLSTRLMMMVLGK